MTMYSTDKMLVVQGVCVASYGTDEFPAFFSRRSGCKAPARVNSPEQAAELVHASLHLGLGSGTLIGEAYCAELCAALHANVVGRWISAVFCHWMFGQGGWNMHVGRRLRILWSM